MRPASGAALHSTLHGCLPRLCVPHPLVRKKKVDGPSIRCGSLPQVLSVFCSHHECVLKRIPMASVL